MPAAVYVPEEDGSPYYRRRAGFWATLPGAAESDEAREPGAVAVPGSTQQLQSRLLIGDIVEMTGRPIDALIGKRGGVMERNGNPYALFVVIGDYLERRTALHRNPEPLRRFVRENEAIRTLPDSEWDILQGPEAHIAEQRLALAEARALIGQAVIAVVDPES